MSKRALKIMVIVLIVAICLGFICAIVFQFLDSDKSEDSYTVNFNSNGGSAVESQRVDYGQFATIPQMPTHDQQIFVGWFSDRKLTKEYDFTTPVTGNITLYAKWTSLYLEVNCSEFFTGEGGDVYFYAHTTVDVQEIFLKNAADSSIVIQLKDDGQYNESGDDLPNDNIFSGKLKLFSDREATFDYFAVSESNASNASPIVSIRFIDRLTAKELNDIETVDTRIQAELFEDDDYDQMDLAQRKRKAYAILTELEQQGLIEAGSINYDADSYTYSFMYISGVCGSVIFRNWLTGAESIPETTTSNGLATASVYSMSVTKTEKITLDLGDAIILWSFNQAWDEQSYRKPFYETKEEKWDKAGLDTTVVWNTTIEHYKNLEGYEVILFSGHGAYTTYSYGGKSTTCSSLLLHQESSTSQNSIYSADLTQLRIGLCSVKGGVMYAILPNFFEHYYDRGDLEGSFVFAENCEFRGKNGKENAEIPNALRDASVECVIGFHNSVMADYSRKLATYFVECLIEGKTAGDSYDAALKKHGKNDYFLFRNLLHGPTAYPLFTGDRNSSLVKVGFENGSFEVSGGLKSWSPTGDVRILTKLGQLVPTDQMRMAILTTGIGSAEEEYLDGTEGSVLSQTFRMPANAETLTFSYDMVSEEPSEYIGTRFDDTFVVRLITENGTIEITKNTINTATWVWIEDVDFPEGDETSYHTAWINISFDVSAYAGQVVKLEFVVYDKGDSMFDTAVLIDNVIIN